MSTTKKQHFIWRKYLVPWTNNQQLENGKIFVYRKTIKGNQEPIEFRELMKIGFEKFYYDISGFTNLDWNLFRQYIANFQKSHTVKFFIRDDLKNDINEQRDYLEKNVICIGENIDNEFGFLDKIKNKDLSFYQDSYAQKSIFWLHDQINAIIAGKKIHATENDLYNILTEYIDHFEDTDYKYKFNEFVCYQYFRSPKIIKSYISLFESLKQKFPEVKECNPSFFSNMNAIFFAMEMSINLTQHFHTYIELLENKTTIPFITGDCPVVNIAQDPHKKLEFYYPITPGIAIIIKDVAQNKDNEIRQITDYNYIDFLNKKIISNSANEVYSNDISILKQYSNS